jgi:hypothetical protein
MRPRRDDFLERHITGRHSLGLHNDTSYFSRCVRSWSGPQSALRKPGQLIVGKIPGPAIGPLGRDSIGVCAGRKQLDRGVQICEIRPLARDPFFEVVNVAADFSALEEKGGDDMLFGNVPKVGSDRLEILVAVAP